MGWRNWPRVMSSLCALSTDENCAGKNKQASLGRWEGGGLEDSGTLAGPIHSLPSLARSLHSSRPPTQVSVAGGRAPADPDAVVKGVDVSSMSVDDFVATFVSEDTVSREGGFFLILLCLFFVSLPSG